MSFSPYDSTRSLLALLMLTSVTEFILILSSNVEFLITSTPSPVLNTNVSAFLPAVIISLPAPASIVSAFSDTLASISSFNQEPLKPSKE